MLNTSIYTFNICLSFSVGVKAACNQMRIFHMDLLVLDYGCNAVELGNITTLECIHVAFLVNLHSPTQPFKAATIPFFPMRFSVAEPCINRITLDALCSTRIPHHHRVWRDLSMLLGVLVVYFFLLLSSSALYTAVCVSSFSVTEYLGYFQDWKL